MAVGMIVRGDPIADAMVGATLGFRIFFLRLSWWDNRKMYFKAILIVCKKDQSVEKKLGKKKSSNNKREFVSVYSNFCKG